jgi:hypothetical protein
LDETVGAAAVVVVVAEEMLMAEPPALIADGVVFESEVTVLGAVVELTLDVLGRFETDVAIVPDVLTVVAVDVFADGRVGAVLFVVLF